MGETLHGNILDKLEKHKRSLNSHLKKASESLVKCQIIDPYVEKGKLHGCVCPWEIGETTNEGAFPICEDFHDTLEAIWVWTYYAKISGKLKSTAGRGIMTHTGWFIALGVQQKT